MRWTNYFSCLGNKSSQGEKSNYKNDENLSRSKTRQEISYINSNRQNLPHRFHNCERSLHCHKRQPASSDNGDGDRQDLANERNYVSSTCDQDCGQASCCGNDCNPSLYHHCPLDKRNRSNSTSSCGRQHSSSDQNYRNLSRGRYRDLKQSSRNGNYSNLFHNCDYESSSNNQRHQRVGYHQDLSRNNPIITASKDIRTARRIRLNEMSSVSTSDHDEYFSCIEE